MFYNLKYNFPAWKNRVVHIIIVRIVSNSRQKKTAEGYQPKP